jgi:penicillin amidase
MNSITVRDMMLLQNDNFNLKASESLPLFLSILNNSSVFKESGDSTNDMQAIKTAYGILTNWDYVNNKDSEGASYYEAWWDNLMPMLWDELYNSPYELSRPTTFNTIKLIQEKPKLALFQLADETAHEQDLNKIIVNAFLAGVASIEQWKEQKGQTKVRWADYKDTYVQHLARLESLSEHVQHGGNHDIVNASARTHGPSWRMVVSLEKSGIKAYGVYPGGQSGNPGSIHYVDFLDEWANGKYFQLFFPHRASDMKDHVLFTTELNPKTK